MSDALSQLEADMRELTKPVNGQYPRPWMTNLTDPTTAELFTVGKNQRNGYDVELVGSHHHFIDTLFNRGPETCRGLYDRMVGTPSPTRRNTDALVSLLAQRGVTRILETNVVCYSTPMSADLRQARHLQGVDRGTEIFKVLIEIVKPRVLISHGSDTAKQLGKLLGRALPEPPSAPGSKPVFAEIDATTIFVIPSLAPPAFNKWSKWAHGHLEGVADRAAQIMRG
jgi:hypothetical protein